MAAITLALTMGDPDGIGAEIVLKSLHNNPKKNYTPLLLGDRETWEKTRHYLGYKEKWAIKHTQSPYESIITAINLHKANTVQGIVTAPISKEALNKAGHHYPGHTEIFAEETGSENYAMMMVSGALRVILITCHIGLIDALQSLTTEKIYKTIILANDAIKKIGIQKPRLGICGINPHAGENGLFGNHEEENIIQPAINKAREHGITISQPLPADTAFYRANMGEFDIIIAHYHDQGLIAVKTIGMHEGVNITVGLNGGIIRTSPDHGTAKEIAGKGIAIETSMTQAIQMALMLIQAKAIIKENK